MSYTVEQSDIFDDSLRAAARLYPPLKLIDRILAFIRWKDAGSDEAACPFSADKPSGHRPNGTDFSKYINAGIRHCHLDLVGTEPLLAYRQFEAERRILMLCVTSHAEMFEGNEKHFFKRVRGKVSGMAPL